MPPRRSARVVSAPARVPSVLPLLPHALASSIVVRVPVDTRLRCREVSPGWRDALSADKDLWTELDLSDTSGVAARISSALLRAASQRAGAFAGLCAYAAHAQCTDARTVRCATLRLGVAGPVARARAVDALPAPCD